MVLVLLLLLEVPEKYRQLYQQSLYYYYTIMTVLFMWQIDRWCIMQQLTDFPGSPVSPLDPGRPSTP